MENIRQLRITKTKSVLIRLTDSDLKELKRRAAELGLTVTSYITLKQLDNEQTNSHINSTLQKAESKGHIQ